MRVSKYFGQTVSLVVLLASPLFADDKGAADDLPVTPEAVLAAQQLQLATKLSRIRDLFDDLRQFEEDVNPRRAKLLKQARKTSDEPHNSMTEVVINLSRQDLRKALVGQKFTIEKLEELLALLKQEDRGERIKTERQRIKEYIKEIERLQRIQRALRGQNESGAEADRLAKGQEGVANRTKDLHSRIKQDESAGEGNESESSGENDDEAKGDSKGDTKGKSEGDSKGKSEGDSKGDSEGDSKGKSEGDSKGDSEGKSKGDSEGDSKGKSEGDSKGDSEGDSKGKSEGDSKGDSEGKSKGDSEGDSKGDSEGDSKGKSEGDSKGDSEGNSKGDSEGDSKGDSEGDSKGDSQGDSKGDSEGDSKGGGGGGQPPPPQDEQNPVRKRIQAAEDKMREAKRKLEEAKRGDSIEAQREAERELALAKKELEEILRQLREEEVERMLAALEGRFRRMLEREIKVNEATLRLNQIPPEKRNSEFDINAGKQSFEQKSIAADADRALVLLVEDGSSIAFPETVEQMSEDMKQVANRLARAQVGLTTQLIEDDIIATLEDLIQALVKAQQDMDDQLPPGPPRPPGPPPDQALVDVIAELKMIRGLQDRINKRHTRYAERLLEDPDDPVGQTEDPDTQRAIGRLADREQKIKKITQDIVLGKNQ